MLTTTNEELKAKIFAVHTIEDTLQDLEKMFLIFMCSDEAENSIDRQSATVTFLQLKKLLGNF